MAERMGRVGGGSPEAGRPRETEFDPGRAGFQAPSSLLTLAVGGLVLSLAWWVLWERSHPAASAARRATNGTSAERLEALRDLAHLGPHDPDVAVPALIAGLSDPDPVNRATAAESLVAAVQLDEAGDPGEDSVREALAALARALGDPEASVRIRASQSICAIFWNWHRSPWSLDLDGIEAAMLGMAADADGEVRASAIKGLAVLAHRAIEGPPPRVLAALEDRAAVVREAAVHGLAPFHRDLVPRLQELVLAAEKGPPECRAAYLDVLRGFRPSEYPPEVAEEMVHALIGALDTPDPAMCCQVIATLAEFGPDARPALPALVAVLEDPGNPVEGRSADSPSPALFDPAIAAAQALQRVAGPDAAVGPTRRPALPPQARSALMALLADPSPRRRRASIAALAAFEVDDAIVEAFFRACRDRDPAIRMAGFDALRSRGERARARTIEAMLAALEDPVPRVRLTSAQALGDVGAGIEAAVPALIRHALHDPDPWVREACAWSLGGIRPPDVSPAIVPIYVAAIEQPGASDPLRRHLIGALISFGPAASGAVTAIALVLRAAEERAREEPPTSVWRVSGDGRILMAMEERIVLRVTAVEALRALAPGTPGADIAVSALIEALDDPSDEVNQHVGEALVAFGPAARRASTALVRALRRAGERGELPRAGRMAEALGRIDPGAPGSGEVVAFLGEVLRSDDALPRLSAVRILMLYGPAAVPAVPGLVELARRPSIRSTRELASVAEALGRIAPDADDPGPALEALGDLLRAEPEPPGLEAVIEALLRFGPAAVAALPRLRELTGSDRPPVAEAARKAVAALDVGMDAG